MNFLVLWGYRTMIPEALWYGMNFIDSSLSLHGQFYIILRDILFPVLKDKNNVECTTQLSSIKGGLVVAWKPGYKINANTYIFAGKTESLRKVGKLFQLSVDPVRPPLYISDNLKGHIRRAYKSLNFDWQIPESPKTKSSGVPQFRNFLGRNHLCLISF